MDAGMLLHMYPNAAMIGDALKRAGWECRVRDDGTDRRFRGVRMYHPGMEMTGDVLYAVDARDADAFPGNDCASVSAVPCAGRAPNLLCPGKDAAALLDAVAALFDRYRALEARMDDLVFRNAGLRELCELGAAALENPICIHDDWFVMIAKSAELSEVLPPDYIMSSSKEFIPRIIIEDFKNDNEYLETYAYRTAQYWDGAPPGQKCLYANLWDGSVYRGRLLVVKYHRDFRPEDYMVTDVLTQRAMTLLSRKQLGLDRPHRSMDDIVFDLLNDRETEARETFQLLSTLHWGREDRLVCVCIRAQQAGEDAVLAHALHSDLFQVFPKSYILIAGGMQCVVLNASQESEVLAMLRHRLAPLCRDYCLYAGISSPVTGLGELHIAYHQAGVALDMAFRLRSEKWIIAFPECALDYIVNNLQTPMRLPHLVMPELYMLIRHDAEKDTQYFETLRAYVLNERDIPRTSEALIIHRTTLMYRLKKIQTIVRLNLDDPDVRLYLMLSLWLLDRLGGVSGEGKGKAR